MFPKTVVTLYHICKLSKTLNYYILEPASSNSVAEGSMMDMFFVVGIMILLKPFFPSSLARLWERHHAEFLSSLGIIKRGFFSGVDS